MLPDILFSYSSSRVVCVFVSFVFVCVCVCIRSVSASLHAAQMIGVPDAEEEVQHLWVLKQVWPVIELVRNTGEERETGEGEKRETDKS